MQFQLPPPLFAGLLRKHRIAHRYEEFDDTHSGIDYRMDVSLPFRPDEQKKIRDRLISELEKNGVNVDPSAELTLRASVKKGKSQKREMSSWTDPFGRRGTTTINFTPNTSQVVLLRGNRLLWKKATTHTVGMLSLKQGESVQAAANRACQPSPAFFTNISLPPYMARLPGDEPLGTSTITSAGVQ